MISFCVLEEIFGPIISGLNNSYEEALGAGVPNPKDYPDLQTFQAALASHKNRLLQTFADLKGSAGRMSGPKDSWWSWVPWSNESEGQKQIEQIDSDLKKTKTDPNWFNTWKHGGDEPAFLDHPIDNSVNFIATHPIISGLGAAGTLYGAYKIKKAYDKKKQEQQTGLNGFSNSAAGNNYGSTY